MFSGSLKNRGKYFIPETTVDEFKTHYIISSELAENLGLTSKTVTTSMQRLHISPILESITEWVPAIYFRSDINNALCTYIASMPRRHTYKTITDRAWLTQKAKELVLHPRSLKDILCSYFRWSPPYSNLSKRKLDILARWRKTHLTFSEAHFKLNISSGILCSRFSATSFISTEIWGISTFIHIDDIAKMADHLSRYFSVDQAANHLSVSKNTIYALIETGKLKTGNPLFSQPYKHIMIERNQDLLNLPPSQLTDIKIHPLLNNRPSTQTAA